MGAAVAVVPEAPQAAIEARVPELRRRLLAWCPVHGRQPGPGEAVNPLAAQLFLTRWGGMVLVVGGRTLV